MRVLVPVTSTVFIKGSTAVGRRASIMLHGLGRSAASRGAVLTVVRSGQYFFDVTRVSSAVSLELRAKARLRWVVDRACVLWQRDWDMRNRGQDTNGADKTRGLETKAISSVVARSIRPQRRALREDPRLHP